MATVLNTATHPVDLSTGRTLGPGEKADDVDTDHPHQRALIASKVLLVTEGRSPRKAASVKETVKAARADHEEDKG